MDTLIRWWVILWSSIFVALFLHANNTLTALWVADKSKISFFILFLFFIVSMFIGFLTKSIIKNNNTTHQKYLPACWFASDAMMGLGMLGTLIGFMLMLGSSMGSINFDDIMTIKKAIVSMAEGAATAVVTTLVGLTCSLLLKLQLVNIETDIEQDEDV